MNYDIREATRNILYDEKIGVTIHIALGRSYPESDGLNVSALHWDMTCDLRRQGEVWVDGESFLKNGQWPLGTLAIMQRTSIGHHRAHIQG